MMPCFALILGEHIENAAFTTAAATMAISNCAHDINLVSSEDTLAAVHMDTVKLEWYEKQRTLPLSLVLLTFESLR